ncbi:B-cell receptor CD22 [Salmo salar]|uniref:B-cell receptor CD22 n=1 Tax=Salmo salar TaxID=8030 RepID=A0ABM3C8U5_SALSA|nr:B-cell receptor CD22-like [Salmo salar]
MNVTYTHQSICSLKGSTVDISCFYTHPSWHNVTEVSWFSKWESGVTNDLSQDPEYADRVKYHRQTDKDSTLKITDLRERDSTEYKLRFKTVNAEWGYTFSGTTLSVTGLQVEVTPATVTEGQRVTLACRTVCTLIDNPNPSYIWYKKGQRLTNQNNSLILNPVSSEDAGRYSCAVEGFEDLPSAEETLTVKYGAKNTLASIHLSGEIVEGSSVTLTCSSDANPPVDKYTCYKKNGAHYQSLSYGNTELQHVFSHIQSSDTGEYYCEARNEMGTDRSESINIDVKYAPKSTSVSVNFSGEIVEGSSVTLTCSSDANPPVDKYTLVQEECNLTKASGQSYSITNIISEDRGEYYCEAENKYGRLNSSRVFVDVQYDPKNTSVSVSPSGELVEGSSVTLTCSSDANPPVKRYTWSKKIGYQSISYGNTGPQHVFNHIKSSDTGEYYCEAWNGIKTGTSESINIDVKYGPKNISVSTSPSGEIVEGNSRLDPQQ